MIEPSKQKKNENGKQANYENSTERDSHQSMYGKQCVAVLPATATQNICSCVGRIFSSSKKNTLVATSRFRWLFCHLEFLPPCFPRQVAYVDLPALGSGVPLAHRTRHLAGRRALSSQFQPAGRQKLRWLRGLITDHTRGNVPARLLVCPAAIRAAIMEVLDYSNAHHPVLTSSRSSRTNIMRPFSSVSWSSRMAVCAS